MTADGLPLQTGREIGERIGARVIVVLVSPHEGAESEYRVAEQSSPRGRNVEGLDLRTLVRRTDDIPLGPRPPLSTTSPDHAVAFWVSKEFGVWNQERVKPRFR